MVMEAGANAGSVKAIVEVVARGLGADRVDLRIGYASLETTVCAGDSAVTRMRTIAHLGVNQRLHQRVWHLAGRVSRNELTVEATRAALAEIARGTPRHPAWLIAIAVGLACAAFGRLLGVDWPGTGPVLVAATAGQYLRSHLLGRRVNGFICTALISFLSSAIAGIGARLAGSETFAAAMVASVLLLVPGVPAVNAQSDILEGYPTLGSARFSTVAMTLVFIAAGLWAAEATVQLLGAR